MRESDQRKGMTKSMMRRWFLSGPAVALVCGLAISMPAQGAPLDPQACEQLQLKLDGLRRDGVEADMALGVAQAKSTLPAERLRRVGVYIETEEQLNFRCGLAKQRIVLPTTIEGGEEEVPAPGEAAAEGAPGALPLPKRAPRAVKDAAARNWVATTKPPAEAVKRRPAAAKSATTDGEPRKATRKRAAKKSDDAYRPPASLAPREEKTPPTAKQ